MANSSFQCAIFPGTVVMNFVPSTDDGVIACVAEAGGGLGEGGGGHGTGGTR